MNIKIALAGNPNSGKTTLFNFLTGSNQYVGNFTSQVFNCIQILFYVIMSVHLFEDSIVSRLKWKMK